MRSARIAPRRRYADAARDTGGRVVTRIWTREEAFAGAEMGIAPDLTLAIRDGGFVSVLKSDVDVKPRPEATFLPMTA